MAPTPTTVVGLVDGVEADDSGEGNRFTDERLHRPDMALTMNGFMRHDRVNGSVLDGIFFYRFRIPKSHGRDFDLGQMARRFQFSRVARGGGGLALAGLISSGTPALLLLFVTTTTTPLGLLLIG